MIPPDEEEEVSRIYSIQFVDLDEGKAMLNGLICSMIRSFSGIYEFTFNRINGTLNIEFLIKEKRVEADMLLSIFREFLNKSMDDHLLVAFAVDYRGAIE